MKRCKFWQKIKEVLVQVKCTVSHQTSDSDVDTELMGFSDPLFNLIHIKSVSARPWHTYILHKFYLFLHNIQPQLKQAWADKSLEKLKPQTSPDIREGGSPVHLFLIQEFFHLNLYGKNLKKIMVQFFFDFLSQFFLFFTFLEHNSHKRGKKRKFLFIEIFDCNLFHWIPLIKTINLISKFIKIG